MILLHIFLNYWKSITTSITILFLSFSAPSTFAEIPPFEFTYPDKIVHMIMYLGLTLALLLDYKKNIISNNKKSSFTLFCIVFPIIFGGAIEIIQSAFFPPRTGDWFDWIADILGVIFALAIMNRWESIGKRIKQDKIRP